MSLSTSSISTKSNELMKLSLKILEFKSAHFQDEDFPYAARAKMFGKCSEVIFVNPVSATLAQVQDIGSEALGSYRLAMSAKSYCH